MSAVPLDLQYALSGLLVGLLVGQTGVGGGSLMMPLLVMLFGVHPAVAVGTDLLFAAATKSVGSAVHGVNRNVDWRLTLRLACGSLPATAVCLFAISRLDLMGPATTDILKTALGVVLVVTAVTLLCRQHLLRRLGPWLDAVPPRRTRQLTVLTGALLGIFVSLTSVGAGAVGVTAMLALYPRLPTRSVIGSDIAHAVPLTLLAGMGHFMMGSADLHLVLLLLSGSLPGVLVGSILVSIVPEIVTRMLLAAVLTIAGLRLVL